MTHSLQHLSEEERQTLADGTIDRERSTAASEHLVSCAECAADVARIRTLMTRARGTAADANDSLDALWPGIRSRIEQRKVVAIAPGERATNGSARFGGRLRLGTGLLGAAAAAAIVAIMLARGRDPVSAEPAVRQGGDTTLSFVTAVDSARSYEAEAQALLDRLELQRAILRPEAARLLERDLRSIDIAIAELKDAIARDPNNATLRQLLASSYRQKIDLLKRANNAG